MLNNIKENMQKINEEIGNLLRKRETIEKD